MNNTLQTEYEELLRLEKEVDGLFSSAFPYMGDSLSHAIKAMVKYEMMLEIKYNFEFPMGKNRLPHPEYFKQTVIGE